MLISRRHARLFVSQNALFIEDLGSANGVLVNEVPVTGARAVKHGDRILVGAQELRVCVTNNLSSHDTAPPPGQPRNLSGKPTERTAPLPALTEEDIPVVMSRPPLRVAAADAAVEMQESADDLEETQRTEKVDGLLTMGRLADRMITMGRTDAAVRLLAHHFRDLLEKARNGRALPSSTLETAGSYGLKLSDISGDAQWANIAIELHTHAKKPLPLRAVQSLETLLRRLPEIDRGALISYKATLRGNTASFSLVEIEATERILQLLVE